MTRKLVGVLTAVLMTGPAWAGPVVNGNFSTGNLSGWTSSEDPSLLRNPQVTNGYGGGGINGPSGSWSDYFAVLDTTTSSGNSAGISYLTAISQVVTIGSQTGTLAFLLKDNGDTAPPTVATNDSGLLLDNVKVTTSGSAATLSFDWYALTHKDTGRNDQFLVTFNNQNLFTFDYSSSLLPTCTWGGGGGCDYGPFSYGTGWQSTCVNVPAPPVPEPATWMLLAAGVVPLVRRRRR